MGLLNVDAAGHIDRERFTALIAAFERGQGPVSENGLAIELLMEFRAAASELAPPARLPDLA